MGRNLSPFVTRRNALFKEIEKDLLEEYLQKGGSVYKAAVLAGLDRPNLYRLIRRHGIETPQVKRIKANLCK